MKNIIKSGLTAAMLCVVTLGAAQAATVVTGGRCTSKQTANKLTSCKTSEFTNSAGQTGYKCTCSDLRVIAQPGGEAQPQSKKIVPNADSGGATDTGDSDAE